MKATPTRLRLSRKKGFNLQKHSKATNGLNAVNVARPSKWGNPFKADDYESVEQCLWDYNIHLHDSEPDASELKGKNLACWCGLDALCHADVLLRYANLENNFNIERG